MIHLIWLTVSLLSISTTAHLQRRLHVHPYAHYPRLSAASIIVQPRRPVHLLHMYPHGESLKLTEDSTITKPQQPVHLLHLRPHPENSDREGWSYDSDEFQLY